MVQDFVSLVINLDCAMLNLTIINQSINLYLSSCQAQAGDLRKIKRHFSNSYLPIVERERGRQRLRDRQAERETDKDPNGA